MASFLELWLILLLPWVLDLLGGRHVMGSIFAALLWGMAVAVASARSRSRDARFRKRFGTLLMILSTAWLIYWLFFLVFELPPPPSLQPRIVQSLTLTHAGLLAAGAGMVAILMLGSILWLAQEARLRKSSWERRQSRFNLTSLEGLARLCQGSVLLAFAFWGFGALIAFGTALIRWHNDHASDVFSWSWIFDSKVLGTGALWLILVIIFQLDAWIPSGGRRIYKSYAFLAVTFLLLFAGLMHASSTAHSPVSWFLK